VQSPEGSWLKLYRELVCDLLKRVREGVILGEVVNGNARPLYIYAEREKEKKGNVSA
jgi:hypothetical protein